MEFPLSSGPVPSIFKCPVEILIKIVQLLDPWDRFSFSCVSQKAHAIASDHLYWKYYCRNFEYWQDSDTEEHVRYNSTAVNWKTITRSRVEANLQVERLFEKLLTTEQGHDELLARISQYGYDAKDFLMQQRSPASNDPRFLCRRWWAQEALNAVHRGRLLTEWASTMNAPPLSRAWKGTGYKKYRLERMVCDLGLAILRRPDHGLETLSARLDALAMIFIEEHPRCMEEPVPRRAALLYHWFNGLEIADPNPRQGLRVQEHQAYGLGYAPFGQSKRILKNETNGMVTIFYVIVFICLTQRLEIPACFSNNGVSIVMPYSAEPVPIPLLSSGASARRKSQPDKLARPTFNRNIQLTTEDEFLLVLLRYLARWVDNEQYGVLVPHHARPIALVTEHMLSCGRVLLAQLLVDDVDGPLLHASLALEPADAWILEGFVLDWLEHPQLHAHADGDGGDSDIDSDIEDEEADAEQDGAGAEMLLAYLQRLKIRRPLPGTTASVVMAAKELGCVGQCGGTRDSRCPQCPQFRIGDVVCMPLESLGLLEAGARAEDVDDGELGEEKEEDDDYVVGIVIGRCIRQDPSSGKSHYSYTCLFDPLPVLYSADDSYPGPRLHRNQIFTCDAEDDMSLVKHVNLVPSKAFFMAGRYFQRFDEENCRFVSNITGLYPHG